jgi:hypothetical protein
MISCRADLFKHFDPKIRKITVRFETITHESAARGDFASQGIHTEFEYDPVENDVVDWAIDNMETYGPFDYSDSNPSLPLDPHDWYTSSDAEENDDGSETRYSVHLENFTSDELAAIYYRITGKLPQ